MQILSNQKLQCERSLKDQAPWLWNIEKARQPTLFPSWDDLQFNCTTVVDTAVEWMTTLPSIILPLVWCPITCLWSSSPWFNYLCSLFDCQASIAFQDSSSKLIWAASWHNQQNAYVRMKPGSLATNWAHCEDSDQPGHQPLDAQSVVAFVMRRLIFLCLL